MIVSCSSRVNQTNNLTALKLEFPEYKQFVYPEFEYPKKDQPFIWFSVTGGSELSFTQLDLTKLSYPIILYSIPSDNSSAASQEISFYLRSKLVPHIHCKSLEQLKQTISNYQTLNNQIVSIINTKILRIGDFSDWLINEKDANWLPTLPSIVNMSVSDFMKFPYEQKQLTINYTGNHCAEHVQPAIELYNRLQTVLNHHQCQALTVKCFDLLMTYAHHAACYPYALLQKEGVLCACEGELSSLLGMIMLRQFHKSGIFMANYIQNKGNIYSFAHCTAPLCGLKEIGEDEEVRLRTHFETRSGLSVTVKLQKQRVIVFKLRLGQHIFQMMTGNIIKSPLDDIEDNQCRTQVEIEMDAEKDVIGNHYLICKEQYINELKQLLRLYGFFEV